MDAEFIVEIEFQEWNGTQDDCYEKDKHFRLVHGMTELKKYVDCYQYDKEHWEQHSKTKHNECIENEATQHKLQDTLDKRCH